mmetsp:Transcript_29896/g.72452  ORF Transcript_29896/g.72452 Transcript_29896/m.72452 type:complete len:142 (+) Transcript_29896:806-1231(+)
MFASCVKFDQDLSRWDTSNVRNMACMFDGASSFNNQSIRTFDMSRVTCMVHMLRGHPNRDTDTTKKNSSRSEWPMMIMVMIMVMVMVTVLPPLLLAGVSNDSSQRNGGWKHLRRSCNHPVIHEIIQIRSSSSSSSRRRRRK